LAPSQELWIEAVTSSEGLPYFYNAISLQAVWERPLWSSGAVVLTQDVVEYYQQLSSTAAQQGQSEKIYLLWSDKNYNYLFWNEF
jgi:hypothetical protein